MNVKAKGYVLGAVAAATYGMNPLFALPLYEAGMNPDSVLFFRYLFAIPVLGIMLKARGRSFKLKKQEILPLIIMGLLVALSSLTLFQSYNYMEAGIASTLLFVRWNNTGTSTTATRTSMRETFAVLLSTRRIRFLWERFEISKKLTTLFLQGKTGLLRYT